ncbi:MAG: hypothetical protein QXH92_04185 [Candidatus Aenigmatarchaeota archaeon]
MPFRSDAQRRYLFANHPEIARRWAKKYGIPKNLPEYVSRKSKNKTKKANMNPTISELASKAAEEAIDEVAGLEEENTEVEEEENSKKKKDRKLEKDFENVKQSYIIEDKNMQNNNANTCNMNDMTFEEKVISAFEQVGRAFETFEKYLNKQAALEQEVQKLIPSVVEALIKSGCIFEHEAAFASDLLTDHVKTLNILKKTAERVHGNYIVQPIGKPGPSKANQTKYASANTNSISEADAAFLRGLGLEHLITNGN